MEYKDYYKVLGVSRDAGEKAIKSAFRKLARECHPDLNPDDAGCEERFKEINEANEVLSDPEKRAKYDQLGAEWQRYRQTGEQQPDGFNWGQWTTGAPGEGQRANVQYGTPEDFEDIFGGGGTYSDFFRSIFGGARGGAAGGAQSGYEYRPRPRRGQDYEQEVEITLAEAYQGTRRILQKDGRRLEVVIPPGAKTGTRIRMSGEGGGGAAGGESGDFYLRVGIQPDPVFERDGDDLRVTAPLDLYTAVLGGEARVQTMSGPVKLTIPEGTQNGRAFRLRGKGMPLLKDPQKHGDLYVTVDVRLPTDLTARQRELFEELQQGREVSER